MPVCLLSKFIENSSINFPFSQPNSTTIAPLTQGLSQWCNKDSFESSFPMFILHLFSYLIALAKTASAIQVCVLWPILIGILLVFYLNVRLAIYFCIIKLRSFHVVLGSFTTVFKCFLVAFYIYLVFLCNISLHRRNCLLYYKIIASQQLGDHGT